MLAYIKGQFLNKNKDYIIIVNQGLGYKIFVPQNIYNNAHSENEMELFLYHHIREDSSKLFGFDSIPIMQLFETFISINGIGPKVGLAIIGQYSGEEIRNAIDNDDVAAFQAVPGIGKKTALRIIIELKSKLPEEGLENNNISNDVMEALGNLGYDKQAIISLLNETPEEITAVEDQIRWAIKNINK